MPKALKSIVEDDAWSDTNANAIDGLKHFVDDVWTLFKDVRPDVVEKVDKGILTAKALHSKSQMLDS